MNERQEQPLLIIVPSHGWRSIPLAEIWRFRELILVFAWRDISVLYKQAVVGVLWVLLQPVATVAIFTVIFGLLARFPSDGLPYPLFALVGLLPWQYFTKAVAAGSGCLVTNKAIVTKTYFPRMVLPISSVIAPLADLVIGFGAVVVLMIYYGYAPSAHLWTLPFFILMAALLAFGISLTLAGLNALYRDVGIALPFLIQFAMYATPIIYPLSFVPQRWQWLISLNPMASVVQGTRWAITGEGMPHTMAIASTVIWIVVLLAVGSQTFLRIEKYFADRV
ncbi:ABC transporter permease [cf. Phormidesmis sp. LEGE 11477]|uniref:ABC transporter permease n=1 Tax=cf. Phormidesmis sp. LEGE 11477 TaxID=1828680 RepID=UPI001880F482|nr:ABC transporter permease [cf. Phormidesmis sp. LEGE 11477]MBE9064842.1 ABC transporter permease [cf. Phormidesmis sp. LEGE 11477]